MAVIDSNIDSPHYPNRIDLVSLAINYGSHMYMSTEAKALDICAYKSVEFINRLLMSVKTQYLISLET